MIHNDLQICVDKNTKMKRRRREEEKKVYILCIYVFSKLKLGTKPKTLHFRIYKKNVSINVTHVLHRTPKGITDTKIHDSINGRP